MLYPALWAYRTSVKTATNFSPFQLVHSVESILPIECEIPSLRLEFTLLPDTFDLKQHLVDLKSLDKQRCNTSTTIKANKRRVKVQYDNFFCPWLYVDGDLVLLYDQAKEPLGGGKFKSM
jgi:hypothetical protein